MNIFFLDEDPIKCARYHCNRHVVKMPLEAAQLLCTAINLQGDETPYKTTHKNHPCAIWARTSDSNFEWLRSLGLALCTEFTYRYNKKHACEDVLANLPTLNLTGEFTQPALAMPDKYKVGSVVDSYRKYYRSKLYDKNGNVMLIWSPREEPDWYVHSLF